MNNELRCLRCDRTRPSIYYLRAPALCTECFARLGPSERARVEADSPNAPWQTQPSATGETSKSRAIGSLASLVVIGVFVWAHNYTWALILSSGLLGYMWREYQHRRRTA